MGWWIMLIVLVLIISAIIYCSHRTPSYKSNVMTLTDLAKYNGI